MGFFNLLFSVHSGIKNGSKDLSPPDWKYKDLRTTPYLYGSDYLSELHDSAKEDWQRNDVYNHMVRYDVHDKYDEETGYYAGYEKVRRKHFRSKR
ncbi:hypothetical protein [Halobacillus karajensis]|uniref:hypothetical protein n=1 Tax=Halobacillus karajensis TaxID=195088 RepID=UPI00045D078B|nr:hypothetical protein [Halobacillus karajensis]CDQ17930.1 hypothetical protein BN982_00170 [Halobacillus karajensis]